MLAEHASCLEGEGGVVLDVDTPSLRSVAVDMAPAAEPISAAAGTPGVLGPAGQVVGHPDALTENPRRAEMGHLRRDGYR